MIISYCPFKTSLRLHHILSSQHYGRKVLCVKSDLQYDDFSLKTKSSKLLMMT
jgi:hypothetical protein